MRPALGEVFPRMARLVGDDVYARPVGGGPVPVVRLHALLVRRALVAEQGAKPPGGLALAHQPVPVVVPGFVPKVAEQGAVWLVHRFAHAFAQADVRFHQIHRDATFRVAGENRIGGGVKRRALQTGVGEHAKAEAVRVRGAALHRQPKGQQTIQQPTFGLLHFREQRQPTRRGQIRHHFVQPAGEAKGAVRRQPIAGAQARVARAIAVVRLHRAHRQPRRVERQGTVAVQAAVVLEVNRGTARAAERSHRANLLCANSNVPAKTEFAKQTPTRPSGRARASRCRSPPTLSAARAAGSSCARRWRG